MLQPITIDCYIISLQWVGLAVFVEMKLLGEEATEDEDAAGDKGGNTFTVGT